MWCPDLNSIKTLSDAIGKKENKMKQVYLIHASGMKFGPCEKGNYYNGEPWIKFYEDIIPVRQLSLLGFTIQEVLPEKITITKEQYLEAVRNSEFPHTFGNIWQKLCEEAGK